MGKSLAYVRTTAALIATEEEKKQIEAHLASGNTHALNKLSLKIFERKKISIK